MLTQVRERDKSNSNYPTKEPELCQICRVGIPLVTIYPNRLCNQCVIKVQTKMPNENHQKLLTCSKCGKDVCDEKVKKSASSNGKTFCTTCL